MKGQGLSFLKRCLTSLQMQINIPPGTLEIIISDQSTDKTIENFCKAFGNNLHYYRIATGCGNAAHNLNAGIFRAKGQYLKILFQDDFLFNEKSLENQFNFINLNENIEWFFTKFFHTFDGKNVYNLYSPKWNSDIWSGNNTLGGPSGLTMKNENLPKFDNNLIWLMDCDFYQKMYIKYGEPLICNDITVVNRTSDDQLTTTIKNEIKINEHKIVNEKYGK
jgi:hypothetical protein